MAPVRAGWCLCATVMLLVPTHAADAQEVESPELGFIPPFIFGAESLNGTDTEVRDLRLLFHVPVIPVEDRRWGLRLRISLYAGVYDVALRDVVDLDDIRFQSLGGTPGVELLVPVGGRWLLKPFADIGYARDFDSDTDFLLWSAGLRTLGTYAVRRFDVSVGTKVRFLSVHTSKLDLEERFGELMAGLDATHPLPFHINGNRAEISSYYIYRHYIDARIERAEGDPLTLEYRHEVGLRFGTDPRIKLWFIRLPSIGLGYRWGDNVRGVRISFGFPF